jgi:hypothetical protein
MSEHVHTVRAARIRGLLLSQGRPEEGNATVRNHSHQPSALRARKLASDSTSLVTPLQQVYESSQTAS